MKRILSFALLTLSVWVHAQIPPGYYSTATGTGYTLKTQLHNIIDGHTPVSYADLWTSYFNTDRDTDGTIYDRYSENPGGADPYNFTYGTDQCGSYSGEADCYNREHSWPKSWFNDANPMYTDIFHVIPTDGYVNGQRGNLPYGETNSPNWTSQNGSKRGPARAGLNYSGTVFEPIDEFKGDFARIYFYMATRYEDVIAGWPGSDMLDGSSDKVFTSWALAMLLDWHANDPVSQVEIDRNNYIYYNIQGNRNPFVDNPTYANSIWGGGTGTSYCQTAYYASICQGDSYSWSGNVLTSAGQYVDTVNGGSCDTVRTLYLTVNNPTVTTLSPITICTGDAVVIFGVSRTTAGTYQQTYTATNTGCDSTVYQQLFVVNSLSSTDSVTICAASYSFGSQVLTSSGTYVETFTSGNGCDSVVTLHLQLGGLNTDIVENGGILAAVLPGAQYQWLDCQNFFQPIQGGNSQGFTPTASGFYAVQVTQGACIDTSDCVQYTKQITDGWLEDLTVFRVYPNPAGDYIVVQTASMNTAVRITDALGRSLIETGAGTINIAALPSGMYYVEVSGNPYRLPMIKK